MKLTIDTVTVVTVAVGTVTVVVVTVSFMKNLTILSNRVTYSESLTHHTKCKLLKISTLNYMKNKTIINYQWLSVISFHILIPLSLAYAVIRGRSNNT